ncbi:hypothetical protein AQ914_04470 [Burkholderia pseudomallei]|nr:hypothetical protein AQ914_04470 [Burkholderia pseudomallei]
MAQLAAQGQAGAGARQYTRLDDAPHLTAPRPTDLQATNDASEPESNSTGQAQATSTATNDLSQYGHDSAAKLTALVGQVMAAMGNSELSELESNTQLWNSLSQAEQQEMEQLQEAYDNEEKLEEAAQSAAQKCEDNPDWQTKAASAEVKAKQAYASAKAAGDSSDDLAKLEQKVKYTKAIVKLVNPATWTTVESNLEPKVQSAQTALNTQYNEVVSQYQQSQAASALGIKQLQGQAEVTLLMGEIAELTSNSSVEQLNSKEELYQEMQKSREADAAQKSADFEQQEAQAEQAQKTMGCIGKILGVVCAVVGVVAAAFTGGASLALAGVALALTVGDQIDQAITGKSFLSKIMSPITNLLETVLKPVMNFFSSAIGGLLKDLGVSADTAQMIGAIMGAVLTGAVLVAAAMFGGSAASSALDAAMSSEIASVIASQISEFIDSTFGDLLSTVVDGLESVTSKVSSFVTQSMDRLSSALGQDSEDMAFIAQKADVGLGLANAGTQAGMGVYIGVIEKKAADALADLKRDIAENKLLAKLLSQAVDAFAAQNKALSQMLEEMSNVAEAVTSTGTSILNNARAI